MSPASLSLTHLIRPPLEAVSTPAVVFLLHGYGSNEEDLFSFAEEMPKNLFIISVRAPYPIQPYGHAWYAIHFDAADGKWSDDQQAVESREAIVSFMEEAIDTYNVDRSNCTLLGFSQGAILSYAVALSYPEKIKNVIALSGYINQGIFKEGYAKHDFSKLQVYTSHGQVDQVIPLEWAQRTPKFLEDLGIASVYEEYPVGHGVAPQNFYSFRDWLKDRI